MRPHPPWLSRQYLALSAAAILSVCLVAACSSSGSSSTGTTNTSSPTNTKTIVIGAVRDIPLDEVDGQRVLSNVQPTIAQLAARCVDKQAGDIGVLGI